MKKNHSEKNVQTITDDHIKVVDEKVSLKEKEIMTYKMNPLNHVAIIMDGNGRWGLKIKIQEMLVIKLD